MVLFNSMTTVTCYTCGVVAFLLWYGTKTNPFQAGGVFIWRLATKPIYLIHFLALLLILYCNTFELQIERNLKITWDFTPFFQSIEGHFVRTVQQTFQNGALTDILAFMYVVVFQALLIASLGVYAWENKNGRNFYATCYAVILNYVVAIPFYLFFPVNEVWSYDHSVKFLMLDVFPNFEAQYRALSGINNCFPSLHTSISVTLAVLAIRSGNKRWAWLCSVSAALIIFAIFYLGIHWLIDMLGGLALGLLASTCGIRLSALSDKLRSRRRTLGAGMAYAREDIK